jgi:imidazole glycerol phosphate synthase subunit HisF
VTRLLAAMMERRNLDEVFMMDVSADRDEKTTSRGISESSATKVKLFSRD